MARAERWLTVARAIDGGGRGFSLRTAQEGHLSLHKVTLLALSAVTVSSTATQADSVVCSPVNKTIPKPHKALSATLLLSREQFQQSF